MPGDLTDKQRGTATKRASLDEKEDIWADLCHKISRGLGPFGYQWLCGCAVYPKLRFPLTLRLGVSISRALKRTEPTEDEALALFRLPWFRNGAMPEPLRVALATDLLPELHDVVRDDILRSLYTADQVALRGDADQPVPLLRPSHDWALARGEAILHRTGDAAEIDDIFRNFMHPDRIASTAKPSNLFSRNRAASSLFLIGAIGSLLFAWVF